MTVLLFSLYLIIQWLSYDMKLNNSRRLVHIIIILSMLHLSFWVSSFQSNYRTCRLVSCCGAISLLCGRGYGLKISGIQSNNKPLCRLFHFQKWYVCSCFLIILLTCHLNHIHFQEKFIRFLLYILRILVLWKLLLPGKIIDITNWLISFFQNYNQIYTIQAL